MDWVNVGEKLTEILSGTGFPLEDLTNKSFDWISDIPKIKHFIKWLLLTITDDNYICHEELVLFEHFKKNCQDMTEVKLENELRQYILLTPEDDANPCRVDCSILASQIESSKAQLSDLKAITERLDREKASMEKKYNNLESREEAIKDGIKTEIDRCMNLRAEYTTAVATFEKNLNSLTKTDANSVDQQCLGRQPLNEYLNMNELFEKKLNCLKHQLEMVLSNESGTVRHLSSVSFSSVSSQSTLNTTVMNTECRAYISKQMNRVFNGIKQAEMDNITAQYQIAGVMSAIEFLKTLQEDIIGDNFKFNLLDMKFAVLNAGSEPWSPCKTEPSEKCERYVRATFSEMEKDERSNNIKRWEVKLSQLAGVERVVRDRRVANDTLWLLLESEARCARAAAVFLAHSVDTLHHLHARYRLRMTWMSTAMCSGTGEITPTDPLIVTLGGMLRGGPTLYQHDNACVRYEDVVERIARLEGTVSTALDHLIAYVHQRLSGLYKVFKDWKGVDDRVFTGATRTIVLFTPDIADRVEKLQGEAAAVQRTLCACADKFTRHSESLKGKHRKQLAHFWVDFLTRPLQLVTFMQSVEEDVKTLLEDNESLIKEHQRRIHNG